MSVQLFGRKATDYGKEKQRNQKAQQPGGLLGGRLGEAKRTEKYVFQIEMQEIWGAPHEIVCPLLLFAALEIVQIFNW